MKRLYKAAAVTACVSLSFTSSDCLSAAAISLDSSLREEAAGQKQENEELPAEYQEGNGFQDIADVNPLLRVEGANYQRSGNYLLYTYLDTALYRNHSNADRIKTIGKNTVLSATKRYGNWFYLPDFSGWVYQGNRNFREIEIIEVNRILQTKQTLSVYEQPLFESGFKTGELPAGEYAITKRAGYFAYAENIGWILTAYKDDGSIYGKVTAVYEGTREGLSTDHVAGIPLKKQLIASFKEEGRPGIPMVPQYVTIHNTANSGKGADAKAHAELQYRGNSRWASWHFQVDDKEIWQSLPMNEMGWHAGDGNDMGNAASIAIEICENSDGSYAKAELNAAKLTAHILYENGLPADAVKQHKDWSGKDCPHNIIDQTKGTMGWETFKKEVKNEYNKLKAAEEGTDQPVVEVSYKPGDVNGDGKVSSLDYIKIKNHIMQTKVLEGKEKERADVNKDGKITSLDYIKIKNHIMGTNPLF